MTLIKQYIYKWTNEYSSRTQHTESFLFLTNNFHNVNIFDIRIQTAQRCRNEVAHIRIQNIITKQQILALFNLFWNVCHSCWNLNLTRQWIMYLTIYVRKNTYFRCEKPVKYLNEIKRERWKEKNNIFLRKMIYWSINYSTKIHKNMIHIESVNRYCHKKIAINSGKEIFDTIESSPALFETFQFIIWII